MKKPLDDRRLCGLVEHASLVGRGALDQHRCSTADHLPHLGKFHGRPCVLADGTIQSKRDIARGVEQRAIEIEQYRRHGLVAPTGGDRGLAGDGNTHQPIMHDDLTPAYLYEQASFRA